MTVLVTLRPGVTFEQEAAASWARMEAERGRPLDVNRSTVSDAEQQEKYDAYLAYLRGGPWAPLALPPGKSWHGQNIARAADTDDDEWIRAHPHHGWRFVVKDEKWHAQYYPHLDKHRGAAVAGGGASPFPNPNPESETDDMNVFLMTCEAVEGGGEKSGLNRYLVNPWEKSKRLISSEEETVSKAAGIRAIAGAQPKAYGDLYRTIA